jgi:hypothetical protein
MNGLGNREVLEYNGAGAIQNCIPSRSQQAKPLLCRRKCERTKDGAIPMHVQPLKHPVVAAFALCLCGSAALASNCPPYTYTFTNGTTADASQVNTNFTSILNCANNSLAPIANPSFTGNVGIGTSSPSQQLQLTGNMLLPTGSGDTNGNLFFSGDTSTGTNGMRLYAKDASGGGFVDVKASSASNGIIFRTDTTNAGTERMRITAAGNVGIGTGAPADLLDASPGTIRAMGFRTRPGTTGPAGGNAFNIYWTGPAAQLWIDSTEVGQFSFVSDRRLKQQIEPATAGLSQVMQLRPVTFSFRNVDIFRDDGIRHGGFIADELQTVIPSAVDHRKDEVDPDGRPVYQTINPVEIIPVLTKAIQDQHAEIEQLRAAVEALKSSKQGQP